MYGVCRLHLLQELHLTNNGILTIEGLKELVHLRHLDLQGNNIKTIEHLNSNLQLEYLNIAENSIGNISDISMLKNLKVNIALNFQVESEFVAICFAIFVLLYPNELEIRQCV